MRTKTINDRMNTCPECNFTAFFMYKDAADCPLCPKCSAAEIQAFKDATKDIDDELESSNDEDLEAWGIDEHARELLEIDELDF